MNNTTGDVTISGTVRETQPGQDPSYTNISLYDNHSSGSASNSGGDSVSASYTANFPDGSYTAYNDGDSTSNPGNIYTTCSTYQNFTVARLVNGSCSATHYNCSAGNSTNNVNGSTTWTWTCAGINGGTSANCSENKPINGSCSSSHYNCSAGTSTNNVNGSTTWTWSCAGAYGGTTANCSENKPINGVCSASHYVCSAGTSASNVDGAYAWTWNCNGAYGGTTANCSENKPAMSGTISASNCSIAVNASSCSSSLTWSTTNPIATSSVTTPTSITVATGNSGSTTYPVSYGTRTFYLYNYSTLLSQATATASCTAGTGWDSVSGTCKTSIDGGWSAWGVCSVSACGSTGTQSRTCTNPTPAYGGAACVGSDTQSCSTAPCASMSGTLSGSACVITAGNSSCTTNLSWSISLPEATPTAITASGMTNINVSNTLTSPQSGVQAVTVPYSSRIFYLYNNAKSLVPTSPSGAGITITSSCDTGTVWYGGVCTAGTVIDGGWSEWSACSATACGTTGTQTRTCTNPVPQNGGADCVGASSQSCTAPSTVTVTVNPASIIVGDPSTLTWTSCSSTCAGTNFDTGGAPSGSIVVYPTATTTYTATCDTYSF